MKTTTDENNRDPVVVVVECDYLVIGCGAAGMSFVDTLLTEDKHSTVIMVDRKSKAGGHWLHAYPFVKLHQNSCNYGVNSLRLGKPEFQDTKGREKQNSDDRATAEEICTYYEKVTKQFEESGRVRFFFNTSYEQRENDAEGKKHVLLVPSTTTTATSSSQGSSAVVVVNCKKVVTNLIDVLPPSLRDGPTFPVHESICVKPVNDLPSELTSGKYHKYVVIGAGKTGVDSLTYLLNHGIDKTQITWVRSQKVWYSIRDGIYVRNNRIPWTHKAKLIDHLANGSDWQEVFRELEAEGFFGRVDPEDDQLPEVFKSPIIDRAELEQLRSLKDQTIDLGRVASITADSMVFKDEKTVPFSSKDTLFVDCMAEDFNGYAALPSDHQFFSKDKISLGPFLVWANPSFSSSIVAFLEATISDDSVKNDMLFFQCGETSKAAPEGLIFGLYCQLKTLNSLQAHPAGSKFVLESRTNDDSPKHHGGLLKLLWAAFGPLQLKAKGDKFIRHVDNGGYSDMNNRLHESGNMDRPVVKKVPKSVLKKNQNGSKKQDMKGTKPTILKEESAVTTIAPS